MLYFAPAAASLGSGAALREHGLIVAVAALAQVALTIGMHWNLLPAVMITCGQQDALSYLLYLAGGQGAVSGAARDGDTVRNQARPPLRAA